MHPMLNTAIKAARLAGKIINSNSKKLDEVTVKRKGPRDYVTGVDLLCEQEIARALLTAYPSHAVQGEEFGLRVLKDLLDPEDPEASRSAQDAETAEFRWVIDPIDGTSNFIHGFPVYAVSIALTHRTRTNLGALHVQVTQAVIFDPTRNELFTASRGTGAFLDDRRIRVGNRTKFHEALLGAHWPGSADVDGGAARFRNMSESCAATRRMGSSVLDLAYVAAGRLDGFCGVGLKPWDLAAGSLLVLEAGGLVGDFEGEQTYMETGNVLAASPKIFTAMVGSLQPRAA